MAVSPVYGGNYNATRARTIAKAAQDDQNDDNDHNDQDNSTSAVCHFQEKDLEVYF
jgi:hypothetical protein